MRYFGKTILLGVLIGIVVMAVTVGVEVLSGRALVFDTAFLRETGYYLLYAVVLTIINSTFFDYLNHKVVWEKYGSYRIWVGIFGGITLTMLGIFGLRMFIKIIIEAKDWVDFITGEKSIYYIYSLIITIVVSLFFHALYFYKALQEKKVKEQKVIAGTASAKFDALKNQLDPHFLFNSLNVL
ncbi:MAG: histidine kinase, partial [Maribacter sp.]|nr:histidine kinase [Maribacter sp.]